MPPVRLDFDFGQDVHSAIVRPLCAAEVQIFASANGACHQAISREPPLKQEPHRPIRVAALLGALRAPAQNRLASKCGVQQELLERSGRNKLPCPVGITDLPELKAESPWQSSQRASIWHPVEDRLGGFGHLEVDGNCRRDHLCSASR